MLKHRLLLEKYTALMFRLLDRLELPLSMFNKLLPRSFCAFPIRLFDEIQSLLA